MAGKTTKNRSNGKSRKPNASVASNNDKAKVKSEQTVISKSKETTVTTTYTASTKVTNDGKSGTAIHLYDIVFYSFVILIVVNSLISAYKIRLKAIKQFGRVIHEFDPYFNYRATEVSLFYHDYLF